MKRTSALSPSHSAYPPLIKNLFRDSAVLTFAFLLIVALICL
ncbi:MAG: hypothetical protein AAF609_02645 [Cyanobacteria bacterium P01_C01_bin.120]